MSTNPSKPVSWSLTESGECKVPVFVLFRRSGDISSLFRFFDVLDKGSALEAEPSSHNFCDSPKISTLLDREVKLSLWLWSSPVRSTVSVLTSVVGRGVCRGVWGFCNALANLGTGMSFDGFEEGVPRIVS